MALPPSIELFLRRSQRGVGQINSRTSAKRSALAPFAGRAALNYAPAISSQQQLGGALSGSLAQQGGQLAGGITAALEGIQAPGQSIATHAGGTAATGAGAAGAVGALSGAELGRLRGFSSAEETYAAALPRLAQLAGEQERRGFLMQAQQQLADLSLREAEQAAENERYNREWAYRVRQDQLDRKRQALLDRRAHGDRLYERGQDRLDRKRQTVLDDLAATAAAREYGIDITDMAHDHAMDEATLAERRRNNRARERQAAQNEAGRNARDKAGASGKGGSSDVFYDTREDAFKRAREYANPKSKLADPMSRSTARKRLMAEFGSALIGRGYKPKVVRQMIERALDAAGL